VTRDRVRRIFAATALAFLASVYVFAQWRDLARGPHVDEVEHLHATVLMERGERAYVDFSEHHPPLFWAMLRPLVPATEGLPAMKTFLVRARLLSSFLTALAIFAAALIVWRASGNVWTVITFVALVFAAGSNWRNGLADVRPDSTALAFWWCGAALVLLARRPTLRGFGLGCVFIAALVKPQWPLPSLAIGIVFLLDVARERRSFVRASAVAVVVAAAGIGATALIADLRMVFFHVFTLTQAIVTSVYSGGGVSQISLMGCPPLFRPLGVLLAATVTVVVLLRVRSAFPARGLVAALLVIAAASFAEIVFIYPHPGVDVRFYAFWCLAASALLALLPQSAAALVPVRTTFLRKFRAAIPIGVMLLALTASLDLIQPARPQPDLYWRSSAWFAARLGPHDTIWAGWRRHPLDARDASYYWFNVREIVPAALSLAQTPSGHRYLPPLTERDLPPCRIERGLDPNVRFIAEPLNRLPIAQACFTRLRERGIVTPTPYGDLWMVRR
jgi:hypothetical protein